MKIVLHGRPITKKNSQRIVVAKGRKMILPSKQYLEFEKNCLKQITGKQKLNIQDRINMQVVYYMPTRHRVDLVNLLEATCDILVKAGVIADDNSNIVASHDGSRVLYDKTNPRTEIIIEKESK